MKKFFLFIVPFLFGVCLIVWIYHRINLREVFLHCRFLTWFQFLLLFFLTFGKILAWAVRWKIILKGMGFSKLSFKTLFSARLGEMSMSYVTPGMYCGGEVVRLLVLRKKTRISLTQGMVSIVSDRIIEITSFGIFAFLGVLIALFRRSLTGVFFYFLLTLLPLILVFLIFRLFKSNKIPKLIKFFHLDKIKLFKQSEEDLSEKARFICESIVNLFKNCPRMVFQSIILSLLSFILTVFQIVFFIKFLGQSGIFNDAVLVRILSLFSGIIPIPAALGIYEGINALSFQMVRLTPETGLSFTLIIRLIDFIFVAAGFLIIIYYLSHHFFQIINNKKNNR